MELSFKVEHSLLDFIGNCPCDPQANSWIFQKLGQFLKNCLLGHLIFKKFPPWSDAGTRVIPAFLSEAGIFFSHRYPILSQF